MDTNKIQPRTLIITLAGEEHHAMLARLSSLQSNAAARLNQRSTAILAGDGLLTYAFDVMADPATHPDPAVRCELALGLARASGLGGMAGGQMLDLAAEASGIALSRSQIEQLQAMKTGALLRFGAEAAAIIAKAAEDVKGRTEMDAVIAYLQVLGTAGAAK